MTVAGPVEEAEVEKVEPDPPAVAVAAARRSARARAGWPSCSSRRRSSLLALIVGYPIVKAIYQSFLTDQGLDKATGFFNNGNQWNGVTNYKYWLLQQCPTATGGTSSCPPGTLGSQFWGSVEVTLLFTVVTVVLETIIGMGFALMMNRAFRGRALVRAAILIPWAIPTAVTAKLWSVIFDPQGILNKLLGTHYHWTSAQWPARFAIMIADTWKTTPFIALLILAGLQGIRPSSTSRPGSTAPTPGSGSPRSRCRWSSRRWRSRSSSAPWTRCACTTCRRSSPAARTAPRRCRSWSSSSCTAASNSASALSTITFIFIFAIALGMVRLFNANIVGAQKPKGGEVA